MRRPGSFLLAALAAAACDGAAAGKASRPAAAATLQENLRIGAVEGRGPDVLGSVAAVRADALGRIYVADGLAAEVRVFAPDGRHLRTLGGKGEGPGEFRMISGMDWDPQGRLWVMDPAASRLTVYDSTGTLVGTLARERFLSTTIPWLGGLDGEGRLYDATTGLPSRSTAEERPWLLVRFREDGERLVPTDTLMLPSERTAMYEGSAAGGLRFSTNVPFSPARQWRLAPDGSVWTGTTGRYRLDRIGFGADTLATLHGTREPVPVSRRERDSVAAAEGVPTDRVPAVKPAFRSFFLDPEGRVWVEPYLSGPGTGWDVFSPAGAFLGHVRTDLRLETSEPPPAVRGGHLYAVARDELDVPHVVRLRIPPLASRR